MNFARVAIILNKGQVGRPKTMDFAAVHKTIEKIHWVVFADYQVSSAYHSIELFVTYMTSIKVLGATELFFMLRKL